MTELTTARQLVYVLRMKTSWRVVLRAGSVLTLLVALAGIAAIVATGACKKSKAPASAAPTTAFERVETAALWKLVPADANAAVVVSAGSLAHLHRGGVRVLTDLGRAPGGSEVLGDPEAKPLLEIFAPGAEARVGLDLSRGALAYVLGRDTVVALVPIADSTKLRELAKGVKEGDYDVYDNELWCQQHSGFYACSESRDAFATIAGGGGMKAPANRETQGHLEGYISREWMRELSESNDTLEDAQEFRGAAKLEPGGITFRGRLAGVIDQKFRVQGPPRLLKSAVAKGPTGLLTMRLGPLKDLLGQALFGTSGINEPGPFGESPAELLNALDGDLAGYTLSGDPAGVLSVGVTDEAPFKKMMSLCEGIATTGLGTAKQEGDRCVFSITPPEMMTIDGAIWIADNAIHLGLAGFDEKREPVALAKMGQTIVDGNWMIGAWGFGTLFDANLDEVAKLPDAEKVFNDTEAQLGIWALSHVTEMGMALGANDTGADMILRLRTTWSNPTNVVDSLEPLLGRLARGDFEAQKEIRALAKQHPQSPLAADMRGGVGGAAPTAVVGIVAAVAIPAFMKYIAKSKTTEARMLVKRMSDGARAYYMDPGGAPTLTPQPKSFPKQSTPMTPPAGSCCSQPEGRCAPNGHLWTHPSWVALQFSVDDPHYYSYQYEVLEDGKKYVARAVGDLDCDGVFSTFEQYGGLVDGSDAPQASPGLYRENETE